MNKKILSLVVIICTIICVYIIVFMGSINLQENTEGNKVQVFQEKVNNNNNENEAIDEKKKNEKPKEDVSKFNSIASSEEYKKFKSEEIANQIETDKQNFSSTNEIKNKTIDKEKQEENKNTKDNKSSQDVSVFKVDKCKIKDKMTLEDKEKVLLIASKLSAVDYEKINRYLQTGSDQDIINAVKLLKERLSDKDYKKVKEVLEKFINMDLIK